MRISTWNVNGLRSAIRQGFDVWLTSSKSDIICLQEVKMQEKLLTETVFESYQTHWNIACKPGYSGVATLIDPHLIPLSVERGIGDEVTDREGRVLMTEFPTFILVNAYAPHSHRELLRLEVKYRFCEKFLCYIQALRRRGKPLIIVGDLNVAHADIDLSNPAANGKNAGFLPDERQWITSLLEHELVDAFRLFCADGGHYTWWSFRKGVRERNVGWRLDYVLVDSVLANRVIACAHLPTQLGSDHCPVTVEIDI